MISQPIPRVDAAEKASGEALYLADLKVPGMLHARSVRSTKARGRILAVHYPEMPAGYVVVDARDIPPGGRNTILMIKDDWPVFADKEVRFIGQTLALIVGPDRDVLERLVRDVAVDYQEQQPAFTIEDSLQLVGGPIHGTDNLYADYRIRKGNPEDAFARAAQVIEEEFTTGFQEHIYLETQGALASWKDERLTLHASMQCPYYLKKALVHALGCRKDQVRVVQPHTGGGFGGKEHYPDVLATAVAVASVKTGQPVRMVLDRQEDIQFTPKRHPSNIRIRTALDAEGGIVGMDIDTRLNAGAYETCSSVVLQRAVFTCLGVYDIPNVLVHGRAAATNIVPSDAFRGFGAPQAIFAIELHMDHLARRLGREPLDWKRRYFTRTGGGTVTGGTVRDTVLLPKMLDRVVEMSGRGSRPRKPMTGLGISVFNHGCAFTGSGERDLIQSRVGLRKLSDGRVRILAAGVDIGQGLLTTFRKVVATALEIPVSQILYDRADTDLVPDSGPTCASRSIMIVGYLLQEAARDLKARWKPDQEQEVWRDYQHPTRLTWDQEHMSGDAYPTFGWGVNAVEVEVDPITFEPRVTGAWTVYDVGVAIDRLVVEGQAHGGMNQALGFASIEKMELANGSFRQGSMADYAIPTSLDFPSTTIELVDNPYPFGPFGAKGAGELVFDGGAPAFALAVQEAIGVEVHDLPLTPERIQRLRGGNLAGERAKPEARRS